MNRDIKENIAFSLMVPFLSIVIGALFGVPIWFAQNGNWWPMLIGWPLVMFLVGLIIVA